MARAIVIAAALICVAAGSSQAQIRTTGAEADPVVAVINGENIHHSAIEFFHRTLPDQYRRMPLDALYDRLLDSLIDRKISAQAARERRAYRGQVGADARRDGNRGGASGDLYRAAHRRGDHRGAVAGGLSEGDRRITAARRGARSSYPVEDRTGRPRSDPRTRARWPTSPSWRGSARPAPPLRSAATSASSPRTRWCPSSAQAAFALKVGATTTEPVQTPFGWHVILYRRPAPGPAAELPSRWPIACATKRRARLPKMS